jgi:subtilisin family serine protease
MRGRIGPLARRWLATMALLALSGLAGCSAPPRVPEMAQPGGAERLLIVAVADGPQAWPAPGATGRGSYRLGAGYAGSDAALALAEAVARDHGLQPVDAWSIDVLRLRCMLYRVADGADRERVLQALAKDPRVRLAQPLNGFETLVSAAGPYNDPYVGLQRGFAAMGVAQAQRLSRGEGVRVAVIDTLVDARHPDLAQRVAVQRDFARGGPPTAAERHGTQVAGVIGAAANNGIGIVGMSPGAQLLAYRACWAAPAPSTGARCDSFSLAQALAQALADRADVINLSLGGPADPLLQQLVEVALARGVIVVGALPAAGRMGGFPSGVPGVVVASVSEAGPAAGGTLPAPGREVLTLQGADGYDFASGSSLAAAHVSGAMALLRALQPGLTGPAAQALLQPGREGGIALCAALRELRPGAACAPGAADQPRR